MGVTQLILFLTRIPQQVPHLRQEGPRLRVLARALSAVTVESLEPDARLLAGRIVGQREGLARRLRVRRHPRITRPEASLSGQDSRGRIQSRV